MSGALVAATISVCVASIGCHNQPMDLERKMCGQHSRARVILQDGQKHEATASVRCGR